VRQLTNPVDNDSLRADHLYTEDLFMFVVEHSAETALPAETIWSAWAEVGRWAEWNPDIAAVELEGEFAVGSTIVMTPMGADAVELRLVEVVPGERFTDEAVLGDTVITTAHELTRIGGGRRRVVYRMQATGPAAHELGPAISADFPDTIAGLLEYAGRLGVPGDVSA
jgi:hypothetical protein